MAGIRSIGVAITAVAVASSAARAQSIPRTEWGAPDLQGVWNYGTMTPLQRPDQWAGKTVLTEAEAVAYEQQTIERRYRALQTAGPDWWEPENNVLRNRRTSLIVDPPDGQIPALTEAAQARNRAARAQRSEGGRYDNVEQLSLQDRCIAWPSTGPPMMPTVYNNNVEIVETADYVVLLTEMIHNARVVPLHDTPHDPFPSMYGESHGHWEGDTLVIDTDNFDGQLGFRGSTTHLHLQERFTATSDHTLEYRFTVDDPDTWTRPWTVQVDMARSDGQILEFGCHEGNWRSIEGILGGARYEDGLR